MEIFTLFTPLSSWNTQGGPGESEAPGCPLLTQATSSLYPPSSLLYVFHGMAKCDNHHSKGFWEHLRGSPESLQKFIIRVWQRVLGVEEHVGEAWVLRSLERIRILWEWALQPTDTWRETDPAWIWHREKEERAPFVDSHLSGFSCGMSSKDPACQCRI